MKAIILAGGKGTRLRSVVKDVPKPLAPINGHPFIEILLSYLKMNGADQVVISTGYLQEAFETYKKGFKGLQIRLSPEDEPLFTGGAAKKAALLFGDDPVLIMNGDSFTEVDLKKVYEDFVNDSDADVLLVVQKISENSGRYGKVLIDEKNYVTNFAEKQSEINSEFISAGIIVTRSSCLQKVAKEKFSLEKDFLEKFADLNIKIKAFKTFGDFIDIGVPEDYFRAWEMLNAYQKD